MNERVSTEETDASHACTKRTTLEALLAPANIRVNGNRPWDIRFQDSRAIDRCLGWGNLGLGESFMAGWVEIDRVDKFADRVLRAGLECMSPDARRLAGRHAGRLPPTALIPPVSRAAERQKGHAIAWPLFLFARHPGAEDMPLGGARRDEPRGEDRLARVHRPGHEGQRLGKIRCSTNFHRLGFQRHDANGPRACHIGVHP